MSRERSPLRKRALKLWLDSNRTLKPSAIARALGTSSEQIRKWKFVDKWDELPQGPRRPGAPKGSKNALGNKGGAPRRNENAVKHGDYVTIWDDTLESLERELFFEVDTDPIGQLNNEIRFLDLRIRRALQLRAKALEGWGGDTVQSTSEFVRKKILGEIPEFDAEGNLTMAPVFEPVFMEVERKAKKHPVFERVLSIEEALIRMQDRKAKLIDMKLKLSTKALAEEEAALRIKKQQLEIKNMEEQAW
ncbi:phage terminase small subunit [Paenibacillus silvisoli]|uniref:phage terminase small subunit n=1 Tax=Paenibacillus silvisoli TaxID=3110539 RepID=UPI00280503EF|nr:phage terminase small subunit [Paenibacillus silvisoli]